MFKDLFRKMASGVENFQSEALNKQFNAVPPGRMRETDCVKGPNCTIPELPGIYRHIDKNTRSIDYIGQTNNLKVRQQQHVSSGKLNLDTHYIQYAVAKTDAMKDDLRVAEINHIAKHKPKNNIRKGGNGR